MNLQPNWLPPRSRSHFSAALRSACSATALQHARACFSNSSDSTVRIPNTCCPPKLFGYDRFWISSLETKSPQSHNQKSPCADESRSNARRKPGIDLRNCRSVSVSRHALHPPHLRIRAKQQIQLCLQRNFERILAKRALPAIDVSLLFRHHHFFALGNRRSLRYRHRLCRASRHAFARQPIRRSKSQAR